MATFLDLHIGELREWSVTITDRLGAPVNLDTPVPVTLEVVLINRATGLAVLGLTSGAGVTHAPDQVATPGLAVVAIAPEQSEELAVGMYLALTWALASGDNPQIADDTLHLRVRAARRAADVPAPSP